MDHAARRARLAARFEELGVDALLVTGQVNVRYLTGFSGSNGQLLAISEGGIFLTDPRYGEQSRREVSDLRTELYERDPIPALVELCRTEGLHRIGFESAGLSHRTWRRLADQDGLALVATENQVERLRWIKDPDELGLIERAQQTTDQAFERVVGKLVDGITEREVALELDMAMRQLGAERIGFDTIVAFGEQAAEPHHGPNDRALRRGDVIKIDFGCVVDGYHSDMTRTFAFGEPPAEIQEIHEVVRRAQQESVAAIRSGVTGGAADEAARKVIREAGFGERFGHGLGHGVGLEIHEGPSLRAGSEDVLPTGAVVTAEPGIYLPGVGGVRIEDMVAVEENGGRAIPSSPRELRVL